ncbi:MAG: hypothetical protein K6G29_09785 [Clostridiales bacterium]|nr:hypothetical protein [Clostridiales bacterium]
MGTKLLLKNSLTRYWTAYLLTFLVLFLSVFSLSFFSAFTDSAAYGEVLVAETVTNGANVIVSPASESDTELFSALDLAEIWYEDGAIYLKCRRQADTDRIRVQAATICNRENNGMRVRAFDASFSEGLFEQDFVIGLKALLCAVSAISIYYIFTVLVERQKDDFAVFRMLGMKRASFLKLIGAEFLIVLPASLILAIPAAAGLMKLVITLFFGDVIRNNALGYLAFRLKASNILLIVALTVFSSAFAYVSVLRRYFRISRAAGGEKLIFPRTDFIFKRKSVYTSLPVIKFRRVRKLNRIALLLVAPVGLLALIELNQLFEPAEKRYGCDFIVSDPGIEDVSGLAAEDLEQIESFSFVSRVVPSYYSNNYTKADADRSDMLDPMRDRAAFSVIYNAGTLPECAASLDAVYADSNFEREYSVGDTVRIQSMATGREIRAKIAGFYDSPDDPTYLTLYCTPDNFRSLTGIETTPRSVRIYLSDDVSEAEYEDFCGWLASAFTSFSDERQEVKDSIVLAERMKKVGVIRSSATILATLVSLGAILMMEVDERETDYSIMTEIGGTGRQMRNVLNIEMLLRFGLCVSVTVLPDMALTLWKAAKGSPGFSWLDLLIDFCMALLVLGAFTLLPQASLNRILNSFKKEDVSHDRESIRAE